MNTCSYVPCIAKRKEERDLVIACPMCLQIFHGKCAGLTGRVIDCVNENKGLKWTCPNCKPLDVGLCNMYSHIINGFSNLKMDLHSALNKLEKFEKQFSELDNLRKTYSTKHALLQLNTSNSSSCPNSPLFPLNAAGPNPDVTISNSTLLRLDEEECQMQTVIATDNHRSHHLPSDRVDLSADIAQPSPTEFNDVAVNAVADANAACTAAEKAAADAVTAVESTLSICDTIESALKYANDTSEKAADVVAHADVMKTSYTIAREAAIAATKSFDESNLAASKDAAAVSAAQTLTDISSLATTAYAAKTKANKDAEIAIAAAETATSKAAKELINLLTAENYAKTAIEYATYATNFASDADAAAKKAHEIALNTNTIEARECATAASKKASSAKTAAHSALNAVDKAKARIIYIKSLQTPVPVNTSVTSNSDVPTPNIAPKPLIVAAARRTLFLSRLASDTTAADVENYITAKLPDANSVFVYQFKFQSARLKSSFKISVDENVFKILMQTSFWPSGVLVREFQLRGSRRRQLPSLHTDDLATIGNTAPPHQTPQNDIAAAALSSKNVKRRQPQARKR